MASPEGHNKGAEKWENVSAYREKIKYWSIFVTRLKWWAVIAKGDITFIYFIF